MTINVQPGLADRMAQSTDAVRVQLAGSPEPEQARAAMASAAERLHDIPHPEEPDDGLPSFVSDVTMEPDGPAFWFDIADAEAYDGLLDTVVSTLAGALEEAGATGTLQWWPESGG